ncbi:MAG: protease modulator HflC [Lachnospiraceae bacterium]|nr:protease modulator HflC [Lachnospiraceae bacterium]
MKKHSVTILAALIIIYLIGNLSAVITYPNEYKVIKTMGKISRVTMEPGFSMRIPLIQSETTIPKDRQLYDIAPTEIYTSDKKKMEVNAYIIWRVTDPIKFTQTLNASEASAESKISAMVYGALKATVSATTQEELIASRDAALDKQEEDDLLDVEVQDMKSEDLAEEGDDQTQAGTGTGPDDGMSVIDENTRVISLSNKIIEQLNKDYNPEQYGFEIQLVKIKKLDLPEENKDAVYNRMITERKNIAAAYKAQGESEAQKIRNTTDRETAVLISQAEAKADQLEAEGEAEYMRILSDAYNDPDKADYYLFVRQLDAAKKSLESGNTTLFLDSDSPLASVFESAGE